MSGYNLPDGCTAVPGWTAADIRRDTMRDIVESEWRDDDMTACERCEYREEMECHQSERFPDECEPFADEVEERMQG